MPVFYVTGPPEVEHGPAGNVLLHYPVSEDEVVTLAFRTDTAYVENDSEKDRAYALAVTARAEREYPCLFAPRVGASAEDR